MHSPGSLQASLPCRKGFTTMDTEVPLTYRYAGVQGKVRKEGARGYPLEERPLAGKLVLMLTIYSCRLLRASRNTGTVTCDRPPTGLLHNAAHTKMPSSANEGRHFQSRLGAGSHCHGDTFGMLLATHPRDGRQCGTQGSGGRVHIDPNPEDGFTLGPQLYEGYGFGIGTAPT